MPLKKLALKPGVNRENTRYFNETGWYECDKVRFRQGTPEKIGGWTQFSSFTFLGVCRSLWNWVTLAGQSLIGVGTSKKFYINQGGQYFDVTPIRKVVRPMLGAQPPGTGNPFTATDGSYDISVYDAGHGCNTGDFVTFNGATGLGTSITSAVLNNVSGYNVTIIDVNNYIITSPVLANASDAAASPGGGANVVATYQVNLVTEVQTPAVGWGGGGWGVGGWGTNKVTGAPLQMWTQANFGEDLLFAPIGGPIYYWNASIDLPGQEFTITVASPGVVTFNNPHGLSSGDAIQLNTTGALPTPLFPNITYYVASVPTPTTLTLRTSASGVAATLSGVAITGTAGQFSCTAMSPALSIGQSITISGTLGGTGTITGYTDPTTYYVIATNGSTTFTLSTTAGGSGVVTTAGTPTGLTYTLSTIINTTGTQSGSQSLSMRGIPLTELSGASSVPTVQNGIFISDAQRYVFAFGCNDYGSTVQDPMLIRWSAAESLTNWTPTDITEAGSSRLSHGSKIISAIQTRQEIVVFTDAALYSLQFLSSPPFWGVQLLGDNISIMGPNAAALGSGVVYWMGVDKFYYYDGRVQTLKCDLLKYVYLDINLSQNYQVFASTNEGFNEIWFFYCSANSSVINKYVVYNYAEQVWYYGTMGRTAWLDSGIQNTPIAATYNGYIVNHEQGVDDAEMPTVLPIDAYISSSEFDVDDGDKFGFVWRMLPDLTFAGSSSTVTPQVTLTLYPMQNSGSGTGTPVPANVDKLTGAAYTVTEGFTGQVNTRVRGRQMIYKISSDTIGTAWQHGATRIDIKQDGRR